MDDLALITKLMKPPHKNSEEMDMILDLVDDWSLEKEIKLDEHITRLKQRCHRHGEEDERMRT
jgi:hypothetical protein